MFLPTHNAELVLLERVVRDFTIFGTGDFDCGRRGELYFVTSKNAWIPKSGSKTNCFEDIIPLGKGYPNSHRTEVMIAAFCESFVAFVDGELIAARGSLDVSQLPLHMNALVWDSVIFNNP